MQKNLNVNLTFNANTTAAKAQIKDLQSNLTMLTSASGISNLGTALSSNIMQGVHAAAQLKTVLASSMQGGNLNLAQFNANLKSSGTSLVTFGQNLMKLGPQGQQAFQQLSNSILQAQIPLTKTKTLLNSLAGTFANVVKWQIASSTINALVRSIGSALDYTKDLNESLNNIRIVTGLSAEAMDIFAKKANEASKKLKTSTTDYTNAALIYYQQGLEGKAVEERAETTLKLANVTSQSAEEVSQNMTAIWNNFYDGSRSLEYYADVITALGAATASSSDEIAQGLEKFAAVADTVGLSYEYATTALATVTAQTRQSADVVGTAFKTLFARIQDLELGNTLEDGTTLGQYSEALYKVGVNIKDSNGELKDMDQILDEMGAKWQQIDKDQQVALAKSVAGIRQYTQLIALMDNWDTFEMNLTVAEDAEGTLERQQEIWAESWEAAEKRVKASAQGLYEELLSDDFFIDLNNVLAELIDGFKYLVDAMGGLRGLLPLLIAGIAQFAGPKIITGLRGMSQEMAMTNKAAQEEMLVLKELAVVTAGLTGNSSTRQQEMQLKTLDLRKQALSLTRDLTKQEEIQLNGLFDTLNTMQQITNEMEEQARVLKEQAPKNALDSIYKNVPNTSGKGPKTHPEKITEEDLNNALSQRINVGTTNSGQNLTINKAIKKAVNTEGWLMDSSSQEEFETRSQELAKQGHDVSAYKWDNDIGPQLEEVNGKLGIASKAAKDAGAAMRQSFGISKDSVSKSAKAVDNYAQNMVEAERSARGAAKGQDAFNKQADITKDKLNQLNKKPMGQTFMEATSAIGTLTMSISSLVQGWDTLVSGLKDGNLTFKEILSIITSVTMAIPMFMMGIKGLGTAFGVTAVLTAAATAAEKGYSETKSKSLILQALGITLNKGEVISETSKTSVKLAGAAAEALVNGNKKTGIALALASKAASILEAVGLGALIPVKYADATASATAGAATMAMIWPIGLLVLAIAGLALAIVGVIALFKAMSNAYNADAIAAEQAREKATELAEAYNKIKEAYENLKSSLNEYKDAQNAIDQLKQGTEEWREAIQSANEQVMELIETYPELAEYVENTEGRLMITDEGMKKVQEQYRIKQNVSYAEKLNSELAARQAENKSAKTDFIRNEADTYSDGAIVAASIAAAVIPGLYAPLAGTIVQNEIAAQESEDALEKIQEEFNKNGNALFGGTDKDFAKNLKELGITSEELIEKLTENKDALYELVKQEKDNLEYEKLIAQQKVDNILSTQGFMNYDSYGEKVKERVTNKYNEEIEKKKQEMSEIDWTYGKWYSLGIAKGGTDEGEQYAKEYAKLMGYEDFDVTDFKGDKIKFKYKDGEEEKESSVTYEEMERALAEDAVAQQTIILNYANRLTNIIGTLKNSMDPAADALASFLEEGDLSYVHPEEFEALKQGNLAAMFPSGTDLTQVAQDFGYESVTALQNAIANAPYNAEEALANIARRTAEEIETIFNSNAEALETTTDALEAYAQHLIDTNEGLEDNKKLAAQAAVQHFKMAKGLQTLQKTFEENAKVLEQADKNSIDYYEALGKISQVVEETFGMKVSAKFIEENLEDIEKAANNDVEALQRLKKEINQDFVLNLNISESAKNILADELDKLAAQAENTPIGTALTLNNETAISALNEALITGAATIEDIEAMFNNANLQMPEYKTKTIPGDATTSNSETTATFTGPLGISWTTTAKSKTTTTTDRVVPYFGDNEPTVDENTGKVTSYGGGGSINFETSGNTFSDAASLTYDEGETANKSKKDYKQLKDEQERYHETNEILDDITNSLEKLSTVKEQAFGKDKIQAMQDELAMLDAEILAYDELIRQNEIYLEHDKANISKYGAKFDEDGRILNYSELITSQVNKYNDAVLAYNSGSMNEEAFEQAEKEYETFKEALGQYEETLNDYQKNVNEKAKKEAEKLQAQLDTIDYAVSIKVEVNDRELKSLERKLDKLDSDLFDSYDRVKNLELQTSEHLNNIDYYNQGINATLSNAGATKEQIQAFKDGDSTAIEGLDLTETEIKQIETYVDNIGEEIDKLDDIAEQIDEILVNSFTAWYEKIGQVSDQLEFLSNTAKGFQNIIEIFGKDALGISDEIMKGLLTAQKEAAFSSAEVAKAQMDFAYKEMNERQEKLLADGKTKLEIQEDEMFKTAQANYQEATERVFSSIEEGMQVLKEELTMALEEAGKKFQDIITGTKWKNLDQLSSAIEKAQSIEERYLKDYNKIYNLTKLTRDAQKEIDSLSSVRNKQKLAEFQAEIAEKQHEGVQMSQYELEHMQKRYDLLVAEIALEESRDAKNQVRLQRDQSGSWNYVYTVNEETVNNAMQEYDDALYNYMDFQENSLNDWQSRLIESQRAFYEELANCKREDYKTDEEWNAAKQRIAEYYLGEQQYLMQQLGITIDNNSSFYNGDYTSYDTYLNKMTGRSEQWVIDFDDTVLGIETGFKSLGSYYKAFVEAVGDGKTAGYLFEVSEAWNKTNSQVADIFQKMDWQTNGGGTHEGKTAQEVFSDFAVFLSNILFGEGGSSTNVTGGMLNNINVLANGIKQIGTKAIASFGATKTAVSDYKTKFTDPVSNAAKATENLENALIALEKYETDPIDITVSIDTSAAEEKIKNLAASLTALTGEEIKIPEPITVPESSTKGNKDEGNDEVFDYSYLNRAPISALEEYWYYNYSSTGLDDTRAQTGISVFGKSRDNLSESYELESGTLLPDNVIETLYGTGDAFTSVERVQISKNQILTVSNEKGYGQANGIWWFKATDGSWYKNTQLQAGTVGPNQVVILKPEEVGQGYWRPLNVEGLPYFDTGGYTGSWGPEGKLAILHQKELILNAMDTENILSAVSLVRDISSQLDRNAAAMANSLSFVTSPIVIQTTGNDTLQQDVHITAEFPGITDHNELEIALSNLINDASQYINRKLW